MELQTQDIERALAGQTGALNQLVDTVSPVIQARVARALMRRSHKAAGRRIRQEVEDLTQEVFVSLFADGAKALRAWDPAKGMSLKSFVGLVADRQAASILRTGKRSPWTEDPTLCEDLERHADRKISNKNNDIAGMGQRYAEPENQVASTELLERIVDRLREQLSPLGFKLFQLVCVEERTVKEISEQLDMSADAVYAWRSRLVRHARKIQADLMSETETSPRNRLAGG